MNVRGAALVLFALVFALSSSTPARAGLILQPAGASTNMGTIGLGAPARTRDQSGLPSPGYTSLVTDFDTYIASNPTHLSNFDALGWTSITGTVTGNFDFDLGGSFTIESFALWNWGGNLGNNIVGFTLLADDNPAFSSPVILGSFSANPNTGPNNAVLPEVFTFAPTAASFVRMQITSNNGEVFGTSFGEAAFEVPSAQAVPEPASLTLLAVGGGVALVGVARRRRKAAASVQ